MATTVQYKTLAQFPDYRFGDDGTVWSHKRCGETNGAAHHDDYTKPLEVRWLCRLHHAEVHKSKTETTGATT